jgi:hypothetical protein
MTPIAEKIKIINKVTNSMEQNASSAANSFLGTQKMAGIL